MARVELTENVVRAYASTFVPMDGTSVQVNIRGAGAATIYQAATGAGTRSQPLTTSHGRIESSAAPGGELWVEEGSYDIVVTPSDGGAAWTQRWEAAAGASVATSFKTQIPGLVSPVDPRGGGVVQASTSLLARFCRVIVPRTGTLRDFFVYIGTASGNMLAAVYDTGDAAAGVRTLLWTGISTSSGGNNAWLSLGDPNLAVTRDQQLELFAVPDNSTVTVARSTTTPNIAFSQLPTSFWPVPGGASPKYAGTVTLGSFAYPATIAEASMGTSIVCPIHICRIA